MAINIVRCSALAAFTVAFAYGTEGRAEQTPGENPSDLTIAASAPALPYIVSIKKDRHDGLNGAQTVTRALAVNYRDLDLSRPNDVSVFRSRIAAAARDVCSAKGLPPPLAYALNEEDCYWNAMRDARGQVDAAITQARAQRQIAAR